MSSCPPPPPAHLVLLLESVPLGGLHLVDVLQEVSHPHSRVQLTRVIRRALPATVALRRAAQQAARLVHRAALLGWKHTHTHTHIQIKIMHSATQSPFIRTFKLYVISLKENKSVCSVYIRCYLFIIFKSDLFAALSYFNFVSSYTTIFFLFEYFSELLYLFSLFYFIYIFFHLSINLFILIQNRFSSPLSSDTFYVLYKYCFIVYFMYYLTSYVYICIALLDILYILHNFTNTFIPSFFFLKNNISEQLWPA